MNSYSQFTQPLLGKSIRKTTKVFNDKKFKDEIREADGIIISFAEHNGAYAAVFKNLLDWTSRLDKSMWHGKPMLLLSTSPGGRGGSTALEIAAKKFAFMDGEIKGVFSLPKFNENFNPETGIQDPVLKEAFEIQLHKFVSAIGN